MRVGQVSSRRQCCRWAVRVYLGGMANIAIVYGTTEGQTAKVAQHMAARARLRGHKADVFHIAEMPEVFPLAGYDGVVIGASIHEGHHQGYVTRWVKEHLEGLSRAPTAWFTVCLAINSPHDNERAEALTFPQRAFEQTGLAPVMSTVFAGALKYTQYSWLKRIVMKQIAKAEGGSTDTSQDHEYTDWKAVDAFTDAFLDKVSVALG